MIDIKKAIKDKGQTISAVADKLGITQGSLSLQIKNGTMTLQRADEIAKALGCSLAELVSDNNNEVSITCPHCGKSITLQIKKPEEAAK